MKNEKDVEQKTTLQDIKETSDQSIEPCKCQVNELSDK